jgi:MATE family multidrug resistance protein
VPRTLPTSRDQQNQTLDLLRLALPIIGMMVSRLLMTFIDFAMVSVLGTEAQAAISPATLFVFAVGCLGLGIANGVQTFVSQADGRGEPEQAGAYAWQCFYIAGLFALLTLPLVATVDIWFGWIARLGQHPSAMATMEIRYIEIALWSVAPSIVCIGLNGFFNGVQRPGVTLLAVIASLVVNLVGNWLLIYGNLGFPRMEIAGAAIATVIAWCVRAAVLLAAMLAPGFDHRYRTRRSYAFDRQKMAGLIRVGGPTAVQWLVDMGSWLTFIMLIMPPFGTNILAATNVGIQYMHLSFMPAIGVGIALCSRVGFAIGEGKPERAVEQTRVGMRLTGIYMGAVGLAFLLLRRPLMWLFNADPEVIDAGSWVLIWAAIFQVFDAMSITYMNALRGAGDTRWPAVVLGSLCWIVFVMGGYTVARLAPEWGLSGPWGMCTLYIILLGLLLYWRWRRGAWRKIRLFDDKKQDAAPLAAELPVPSEATQGVPSTPTAAPSE